METKLKTKIRKFDTLKRMGRNNIINREKLPSTKNQCQGQQRDDTKRKREIFKINSLKSNVKK